MTNLLLRWSTIAAVVGPLALMASGCVVSDGGYGYASGPSLGGAGYYEPYGVDYGGWGPGYHVGPSRDGGHRSDRGGGGGASAHAYRSAPASHSMPSIPSRSRSTDSRHR